MKNDFLSHPSIRYIATSPSNLINHLISRNLHLLALRISQHLSLRPDPVLEHWASAKIGRAGGADDEVVCHAIVAKFEKEGEKGVSYAEIAKKAWEAGRVKLATMVCRRIGVGSLADEMLSYWIMSRGRRSRCLCCFR